MIYLLHAITFSQLLMLFVFLLRKMHEFLYSLLIKPIWICLMSLMPIVKNTKRKVQLLRPPKEPEIRRLESFAWMISSWVLHALSQTMEMYLPGDLHVFHDALPGVDSELSRVDVQLKAKAVNN